MVKNNLFLEFILKHIERSFLIKDIYEFLTKKGFVNIGEIGELAKVLLLIYFWQKTENKVLFIANTKENSLKYIDYLKNLGFNKFLNLSNDNICDILKIQENNDIRRRGALPLIITSIDVLLQRTIAPENYKKNIISLKAGKNIPEYLFDYLIESSYERVKKVGKKGEFSIKGDIIDVFCEENPVRIEVFGNKIEKIYYFDPFTFKKIPGGTSAQDRLPELDIYPQNIQGDESFLINFFEGYLLIFDGKDRINNEIFALFQDENGEISSEVIRDLRKVEDFIKDQKRVYLEDFFIDEQKGVNLSWFAPKNYGGTISEWVLDLRNYQKKNKKVFIISRHPDKIKKVLSDNLINWGTERNIGQQNIILLSKINTVGAHCRVPYCRASYCRMPFSLQIKEGINMPDLGIVIFSDKEIFGDYKIKKQRKDKIDFSAITNLKKGEYVVHIDHGIGQFIGFSEVSIDKVKREYIVIEYLKGDKVYVPLDQADKITKYISVGNQVPVLSNLASSNWLKVKNKVKKNVENIAKELLETQALREAEKPFYYINDSDIQGELERNFPYSETPDQRKAIEEVLSDMEKRKPMDRLLCGDVGYGKTEVAVRAAAKAVVSGGQVVFLVPTTILAEQHLLTFKERLDSLGIRIESLSRFHSISAQREIINLLEKGAVDIVIGTHRLLSPDIKFKNLMLIIIDEEQKFGVKHKERLKQLRAGADVLTMTATPIPRTLYLGLSGLKDISLISTPPEGRLPVKTIVVKENEEVIKEAILKEIKRGGQVYFVHNRVETIEAVAAKLKRLLPNVSFRTAHGQMPEKELAKIMNDFIAGKFQVLVCSTIIESGLDISAVNTLIVDHSTNFGLAQLHQLRGRIGRGSKQAYAYFLYSEQDLKGNALRRLKSIAEKGELGAGYQLSLEDLDIRGSGNILGKEQHGSMQMVGVGYYLRLLEEAVERIKNQELRIKKQGLKIEDVKIDLPISAYIPDGFYKKEEEKIRAYQTLAEFEEEESLNSFIMDLKSKNMPPCASIVEKEIPQEMRNLFNIMRLKIRAKKAGITSIIVKDVLTVSGAKKKKLYINFDHVLSKEAVNKIFSINHNWYFGNTQAKIDLDKLGKEWLEKLQEMVKKLDKYK